MQYTDREYFDSFYDLLVEIRDQLLILNKKLETQTLPPAEKLPRFVTSTTEGEEIV